MGVQVIVEAQSNLSWSPSQILGALSDKNDAQDAYGLCFRRSTYGWKGNFKNFLMSLVPPQN